METNFLEARSLQPYETAKDRLTQLRSRTERTEPLKSDEEYQLLANALIDVKKFRSEWDTFMKPIRKATKEAHAVACAQFNEIDDPLEQILERVEPFLLDYERRKEQAQKLEEQRINAEIEKQRDPLDNTPPLTVTLPKFTAPSGLSRRSTWKAEVKSFQDLVLAVAEGRAPIAYLLPNEQALNLQAKALKNEMSIPGVVAVEETSYAAKGRP